MRRVRNHHKHKNYLDEIDTMTLILIANIVGMREKLFDSLDN